MSTDMQYESKHKRFDPGHGRDVPASKSGRNPWLRSLYVQTATAQIPRLLTMVDTNPFRNTYGCFDRNFWHYRTADFPSGMYQESVLSLALVWAHRFPGNYWYQHPRIRELALAGMRFTVRSAHDDGSCDDYYPFERALGATVFSLYAGIEAYLLCDSYDPEIMDGLEKRALWLVNNDETGQLTNHQAWAVISLFRMYQLTGNAKFLTASEVRLRTVLNWQSSEGWFLEYGGCDPGYLSVTIDALAKYYLLTNDPIVYESLQRAVTFARYFLHPDNTFGGHYGSRGTCHFYPHGMEILATTNKNASELAEGFLQSLAQNQAAAFDDDRLYTHRLPNLIQAYLQGQHDEASVGEEAAATSQDCASLPDEWNRYFPEAQVHVHHSLESYGVVSCAKGGTFKLFQKEAPCVSDSGLIFEMEDGQICVMHMQEKREVKIDEDRLSVQGMMHWVHHETATPFKQILFRLGVGIWGRRKSQVVRKVLQRRLIAGRREAPVRFQRTIRWGAEIEVIDVVELFDRKLEVRRGAISSDANSIYTAAGHVFQNDEFSSWVDLKKHVCELNESGKTIIRRVFHTSGSSD